MASSKDVRDIMGFGAPTGIPKPKKKAMGAGLLGGKKLSGMTREILALHGDRPPPVAIVDTTKTYRRGFKRDVRASPWELIDFENEARTDDLRLKHWRKKPVPKDLAPHPPSASEQDSDAMELDGQPPMSEINQAEEKKAYEFAKFNVQVSVPAFTDEQYEKFLKDPNWSREETDYLLQLIKDYSQKWPVIIDRYEWKSSGTPQPSQDSTTATATAIARPADITIRDLEALKARYYFICGKSMEFSLPNGVADMNAEEFSLHEQYAKFRPELERQRKAQAWNLMKRPPEEIKEEEYLLAELQRIMISAQKLESERAELRQRLEHAQPIGGPTALGQQPNMTSTGLTQLYNSMISQDKSRRPRPRVSIDMQSPAGAVPPGLTTPASAGGHRDSLGSATHRKGSTAMAAPPTPLRQLGPRDEERFGVSTPIERITSGVTFRTDKLLKLRQAKSQIQTQKIGQALQQLDIPDLLPLPTSNVVAAFEQLIGKINILLDAKKVLTKEETELSTAQTIKEEIDKAKAPEGGEAQEEDGDGDVDGDGDKDADGEDDGDGEEDEEEEEEEEEEDDADGEDDAEGEDDDAEGEEDDDGDTSMADASKPQTPIARPSSSRSAAGFKRAGSVVSAASSKGSRRKK